MWNGAAVVRGFLAMTAPAPLPLDVYWRRGCGACSALRMALAEAGVTARWHDIWSEPEARAFVRSVAGGNETVPTVLIGAKVLVAPRPRYVLSEIRDLAPELMSTRGWRLLRVVQWVAIIVLLVISEALTRAGLVALSWAADAVAVITYVALRRLRARAPTSVAMHRGEPAPFGLPHLTVGNAGARQGLGSRHIG